MARLPTSADVPSVRSRPDPGVSAPIGAFQSPIGIAAEELAPAIGAAGRRLEKKEEEKRVVLENAAIKQQSRRDTVDRATSINQFNLNAGDELRRLNTESDLSREDVLQEYGKFLSQSRNQFLTEHGGSDDSLANLNVRLMDIESRSIGQAGALSARLGREKVTTAFSDALDPIIQSASINPTPENIDAQLLNIETNLEDLRGAFDPEEEQSLRTAAREQVALSAIDSLLISGRAEVASSMFENRLFSEMSPESQRTVKRRIEGVRSAKDTFDREINEIEGRLGRPLTEQELLSKVGISGSTQKLTEKDRRRQRLEGRGFTPEFADDVTSGSVDIKGPDEFGNFVRTNLVTGESTPVTPEDTELITQQMQQAQQLQQPTEQQAAAPQEERVSLEEAVTEGTGPFAKIRAGVSNVIGPFVEGEVFKETASAKQKVRTFNQFAKTALVNNPKFPVAEQEIVQQLLPDVDAFFLDPDRARTSLDELKSSLNEMHDAKLKELIKPGITSKRRAQLSDQMSRVNEILTLMTEEKEELPEGVPEGSEQAGQSKNGNPVFRTPDGKLLEVVP